MSRDSYRGTSFGYSDRHSLDFLIRFGYRTKYSLSKIVRIFLCLRLWASGTQTRYRWTFGSNTACHFRSEGQTLHPKAIAGYGAARTPRGGWKIVTWVCELCTSVVDKWGRASTDIQMDTECLWGGCWMHGEKTRKDLSFALCERSRRVEEPYSFFFLIWKRSFHLGVAFY